MRQRLLLIVVIVMLLFPITQNDAAEIGSYRRVMDSMVHYLQWHEFWYGSFIGKSCYSELIGKEVSVSLFHKQAEVSSGECKYSGRKDSTGYYEQIGNLISADIIRVYIDKTNMLFTIEDLSGKPRASIDLAETSTCQLGNLVRSALDELSDIPTVKKETARIRIPEVDPLKLPSTDDSLRNETVIKGVKRSMSAIIKYYYFNESVWKLKSIEKLNKIKGSKRLLVGRYRDVDPYLFVYFEGDNTIYLIDFPSIDSLKNPKRCMEDRTRYQLDYPKGDDEKRFFQSIFEKLRDNSIELKLD